MSPQLEEVLTEENLKIATLVIQAIDAKSEIYYNEKLCLELKNSDKPPESNIAEMFGPNTAECAMGNIIFSGHGYRPLATIVANTLSTIGEKALSEVVVASVIPEI